MVEPAHPFREPSDGHTLPLPVVAGSYPVPVTAAQVIVQIGDIQVTSTTVRTPIGEFPLRGSRWQVHDQWLVSQKTPTWAIVCAVVGFCCLTFFSLLFLVAKETVYSGVVQVSVTRGPIRYDARITVTDQAQVQHIHNLVNYVRSLAAV